MRDCQAWTTKLKPSEDEVEGGVIGVVVSSLALHCGDLGSIPGFGMHTGSSDSCLKWRSTPAIIVRK